MISRCRKRYKSLRIKSLSGGISVSISLLKTANIDAASEKNFDNNVNKRYYKEEIVLHHINRKCGQRKEDALYQHEQTTHLLL